MLIPKICPLYSNIRTGIYNEDFISTFETIFDNSLNLIGVINQPILVDYHHYSVEEYDLRCLYQQRIQ
jgi:hypothetical protein